MSKPNHVADRIIEYLFYTLLFFVPIVLWPGTSEVFEFNKMLLVYVLTILIAATWAFKWISQKKITIRRTPLDIPILLFLASQILSTIFSIDTHTSLWGYYSRFHGGLMSTISYIILYYAFVTNLKSSAIRHMLFAILGSATLVSAYGILEHFGIDKNLWVQDVQNRVFSTLGQPNWLSAYLIAILPLPLFLALKSKTKGLSAICYLLSTLFLLTIWFTKSQSGIGATAVVLATILFYFLAIKKPLNTKYFILNTSLAIIFILALVIYKWSFFQKISPLGPTNLTQLVEEDKRTRLGGSDSLIIRQVVWQGARELATKNPLFGTGVETFGYTYFNVRPAIHNLLSEWEFLYNKAHNEYLNTLANTGFFGLITLIILTLAILKITWPSPYFFGLIGIIGTNYFGFSVVPIAIFFYLFPAIHFVQNNPNEQYLSINFHINKPLGLLILLPATSYLLLIPYHQFTADLAYNKGKQYQNANYLKPSLEYLEKAVKISPDEPLFLAQLAEVQAMAATTVKNQLERSESTSDGASISAEVKQSGLQLLNNLITSAEQNSNKAIAMNPYHTNFYKSRAKVELYLGTIDPKYNQEALKTLLELTKLAPTDAKVLYNLGLLYESANQKDQAKIYYQKALDLKPDYDTVKITLKSI